MTVGKLRQLKVMIKTFGCQMNVYDSEVAEGVLKHAGYVILPRAGDGEETLRNGGLHEADILLLNTCSVREHAEDRVFSHLGMFGKWKREKPDLILGLMGCMVEEHKEKLFKRFPQLDLMVGTRNVKELPALIEAVRKTRKQVAKIKQSGISIEYTDQIQRTSRFHSWLPIMTGCNKVCTFCVVPKTRGAEVSMPAREVYREACRLVEDGVRCVTLLGQNVNSYNGQTIDKKSNCHPERSEGSLSVDPSTVASPGLRMTGRTDFPALLEMLCQISGLERVAFTTSHPQDATEELFQVIARNPKISRRFHLPLQSGSDAVLKRMKRLHTYEEYREKIRRLRELVPEISITTDLITGFSKETEADHQATVRALEELRFDAAYIYKYSVRPGTPSSKLGDDVPITLKEKRHAELFEIERRIEHEINQTLIGQTVEVFVEAFSSKNKSRLLGRTHQEKKVVFPGEASLVGQFQKVEIHELKHETFVGERMKPSLE